MIDIGAISSELRLCEDGIWRASKSEAISYPSDGNESCFAVEDSSFWFRHRNNCIVSVVKSFPPPDNGPLFDIGGGNGFVAQGLASAGFDIVLVEPGPSGALNAKKRGVEHIICGTTESASFQPHSLSAIGLFDVIEHMEDDGAFLQSMNGLLREGGLLYATVPAFSFLWSQEDVAAGHFRRYTLPGISQVLQASGFEILFSSYIFRFLPLPIFLLRALPWKMGLSKKQNTGAKVSRDHAAGKGLSARILNALLTPEINNLNRKHSMPLGGKRLIVARRS